jgi:hypothetical protein
MMTPEQAEQRIRTWQEIAGKAHLYETAYVKDGLDPVKILGLRTVGVFLCQHIDETMKDYGCEELTHYCL